ncbi:hypothetical protein AB0M29_32070 [Streptomyces sp. NPDC051976]|uniref:hypothetical protein n=1 Tax=Streptomyces sp. NPDC051976 TaxID=3154947 RepID=UPI00341BF750
MAATAVLCVLSGAALAACGSSKDKADPAPDSPSVSVSAPSMSATAAPEPSTVVTTPVAPPTTEAPLTNASFPKGSCVAEDPTDTTGSTNPTQVDCSSPLAVAKVLSREPFDLVAVTSCPKASETADKLVQVTRLGTGKNASKLEYAALCLRNLGAPHPGDPGQGGGPNIVKGDCLVEHKNVMSLTTGSATSTVETACSATGYAAPNYQVIGMGTQTIVKGAKSIPCPKGTQAEFAAPRQLIGDVYCAVRV